MDKLNSGNLLTPNRFIGIDRDELTVLEQLGVMMNKTNEIVDGYNQLENNKVDKNGDFTGSWHGIKNPAYAEPGIANVVDKLNSWSNNQPITPEDFGAKGDGVADDTTPLQTAIDFAFENKRTLIINSIYLHTGINLKCGLSSSTGGTLLYSGVGDGVTIKHDVDVRGITFKSRGHDNSLLCVDVASGVTITNCVFVGGGHDGVLIKQTDNGLHFNNNVIKHCQRYGIFSENIKRAVISNNSIYGCGHYGISLDGYSHGVVINSNQIFGNCRGGIAIEGEREGSFQKFPGVYTHSQHCVISNNHIDHNQDDDDSSVGSYGMYIERCQRINITGNVVRVARKDGIYLSRVEYGNINLNVLWKNTLSAIRLRDTCSGCMLFANVLGNSDGEKLINEADSSNFILDRYHKTL